MKSEIARKSDQIPASETQEVCLWASQNGWKVKIHSLGPTGKWLGIFMHDRKATQMAPGDSERMALAAAAEQLRINVMLTQ